MSVRTLRCIRPNGFSNGILTVGKLYQLDEIGYRKEMEDAYVGSTSCYYIKGDDMDYKYYLKECFIDIVDERNNKIEQILDEIC
jgi:hypothetical protein